MPLFHDNTGNLEEQFQRLLRSIVILSQAVNEKRIDLALLARIAQLTTTQLESCLRKQDNPDLILLNEIISSSDSLNETLIMPTEGLKKCIQWFDNKHGNYLDLLPLTVSDPDTIKLHLNHLAIFYDVFIQAVSVERVDDTINVDINSNLVKQKCSDWEASRTSQHFYTRHQQNLRLVDKFVSGHLSIHEWLTDLDIQDALRILGLSQFGAHIATFDVRDIGDKLHVDFDNAFGFNGVA